MEGNTDYSGARFATINALYKNTGYDANTSGALINLRENTTHALVTLQMLLFN